MGRDFFSADRPPDNRAEESYTSGVLLGGRILLMIGVIAAAAYYNVILGNDPASVAAMAVAVPTLKHGAIPSAVAVSTPSPDHRQAPVAVAPSVPSPDHRPAPVAVALSVPSPDHRPAPVAVALSAPLLPEPLPTSSALHLRIVYRPSDPQEGARVDALADQLQTQNSDVASATASTGPAAYDSVVYFFRTDRAGASRIATSLAHMTKRPEPVMLVHANPLPRPGTIEIRLAFKVGKDLDNEGY